MFAGSQTETREERVYVYACARLRLAFFHSYAAGEFLLGQFKRSPSTSRVVSFHL